jgi:hypothetical protein
VEKFNFDAVKKKIDNAKREALVSLSVQAQDYFLSSFKKQSFDGQSWQQVQRRTSGTKAYLYPKTKGLQRRTNPILVGSGDLINAVSTMSRTAQITGTSMRMTVNVPYAAYLNDGTNKMVKRQFVGQTQELTEMQQKEITSIIDKIFH